VFEVASKTGRIFLGLMKADTGSNAFDKNKDDEILKLRVLQRFS
jgi:hypothetical protein